MRSSFIYMIKYDSTLPHFLPRYFPFPTVCLLFFFKLTHQVVPYSLPRLRKHLRRGGWNNQKPDDLGQCRGKLSTVLDISAALLNTWQLWSSTGDLHSKLNPAKIPAEIGDVFPRLHPTNTYFLLISAIICIICDFYDEEVWAGMMITWCGSHMQ